MALSVVFNGANDSVDQRRSIMMRSLIILAVLCSFAAASLKVRRLQAPVPQLGSCSITDILDCGDEINQAWTDCQHLSSSAEIITCITDILQGTPHCQDCICDVLGFLCSK